MTTKPDALAARLSDLEQLVTAAPRHGKHGKPGRDGAPGRDGKDGAPGRNGKDGRDGVDGAVGPQGEQGPPGRDGIDGIDGKDGVAGQQGERGEPGRDGVDGKPGPRGLTGKAGAVGPMGPMPRHEWEGTSLRFEIAPNEWGEFVNLQGPQGKRGPAGGGGGSQTQSDGSGLDLTNGGVIAGNVEQRDGVNPMSWMLYNTYTNASNYERLKIAWDADVLYLNVENAGSGSRRPLIFNAYASWAFRQNVSGNGNAFYFGSTNGNSYQVAIFCADNSADPAENSVVLGYRTPLAWTSANAAWSTIDTTLRRSDVGLLSVESGTVGQKRDLSVRDLYANRGIVVPKDSGTAIKIDTTSPDYGWRDLVGNIHARTTGASAPAFTTYRGGISQFSFGTAGGNVEVFNEYHIAHDQAPNTDMYIHAHWSTVAAPTGNVNWLFEILYAKGYGRDVFEGTDGSNAAVVVSVTQAAATAFQHEIAEVQFCAAEGLIDPTAGSPSTLVSITSGAPTLTSASALFTAGDIGRTVRVLGAGAAGADLDTTISAFTSTTQVTLAANAGTTVTNQDAFRYRVLDRALIEVDGLILVRTYRNSSRAADTLDVAPFLHFVDIHYQTTGIPGTKTKNFPFYT